MNIRFRKLTLVDLMMWLVFTMFVFSGGIVTNWIQHANSDGVDLMIKAAWGLFLSGLFIAGYEFHRWRTLRKTSTPLSNFSIGLGFLGLGGAVSVSWILLEWHLQLHASWLSYVGVLFWVVGLVYLATWALKGR